MVNFTVGIWGKNIVHYTQPSRVLNPKTGHNLVGIIPDQPEILCICRTASHTSHCMQHVTVHLAIFVMQISRLLRKQSLWGWIFTSDIHPTLSNTIVCTGGKAMSFWNLVSVSGCPVKYKVIERLGNVHMPEQFWCICSVTVSRYPMHVCKT